MSLLVFMGSGETAPTMIKPHREVFAASGLDAGRPAVMLDTPFGFQRNADDLVAKTRAYFAESVGTPVEVARWRRGDAPAAQRERALALLGRAGWAFAGPGSPTYALRQWRGSGVPAALADVAARGGTLVFGSAAACTAGTHTIPVYEIYKVKEGADPYWEPGLDLLGALTGLSAVVIPHYDNAEGGQHDTRFCYLGEERLAALEADLPAETGVLGVDEHTAAVIDLSTRCLRVLGNGVVTVRRRGRDTVLAAGREIDLADLDALLRGTGADLGAVPPAGTARTPAAQAVPEAPEAGRTSLRAEADAARERFDAALAHRDAAGCADAVLDLEAAIVAWRSDTLQSDDGDHARRVLRGLVVRLGELAEAGARDPREVVGPLVEVLLRLRARARAASDYATADLVRDELVEAGVEVRDTPDGVSWLIHRDR